MSAGSLLGSVAMEVASGILGCFDFSLSVDQKIFGWHFHCNSIPERNESRASCSMHLTLEGKFLNLALR